MFGLRALKPVCFRILSPRFKITLFGPPPTSHHPLPSYSFSLSHGRDPCHKRGWPCSAWGVDLALKTSTKLRPLESECNDAGSWLSIAMGLTESRLRCKVGIICTYVRTHACTHACMYVRTLYVCMHPCRPGCVCIDRYIYIYIYRERERHTHIHI